MTTVPFCNIHDVYKDWNDTDNNIKKIKKSIDTDQVRFLNDNNHLDNLQSKLDQKKDQSQQSQQSQQLQQLPNLSTFTDATSCVKRNNNFENNASKSILNVTNNPLNVNQGLYRDPSLYSKNYQQQYPYNNMLMYPDNILPVYEEQNAWPKQLWYQNMEGPGPYEYRSQFHNYQNPFNPQFQQQHRYDIGNYGSGSGPRPIPTLRPNPGHNNYGLGLGYGLDYGLNNNMKIYEHFDQTQRPGIESRNNTNAINVLFILLCCLFVLQLVEIILH